MTYIFLLKFHYAILGDPCDGIVCPALVCEGEQYVPLGQCCPVCPGDVDEES